MPPFVTAFLIIFGLILIIFLSAVEIVKNDELIIIERLGKYYKTVDQPGLYFCIPFVDRVIEKVSKNPFFVSRKVKQQEGIDHTFIITYKIKVVDEMLYTYSSLDAVGMLHDYVSQTLKEHLNQDELLEDFKTYAQQFGFEILNIAYNN